MESGVKDEKPLALRTWSLNGGVIRIQLTRLADFADGDAIHGAIHAFTKALAGSRAPSDAALVEALEETATYLEALSDNHLRNDVDMLLDDCEDPRAIAEKLRAALAAAKGQQPALDRNTVNGGLSDDV